MASSWKPFPYQQADYDFAGAALAEHWARLHQGDCEPFPSAASLQALVARHPDLEPPMPIAKAAEILQDAWRAFHRGDFEQAAELGVSAGRLGTNVANKAANIYAAHLEDAEERKIALFQEAARRAEDLQAAAESLPNAWYLHAQALGLYSQRVSIVTALAEGVGGKIKGSLDRTLVLEERHADAHVGLGAYHAEVINKMGALFGGLTYGVSTDAAEKHFAASLALNPHSIIARVVQADGLVKMFGQARQAQAAALYAEAASCAAADAMERLDVELARAMLKPS